MKCIIIFTDFNFRAIVAFLRTISKFDIKFGIIAISTEDKIFKTIYKDNVKAIRTKKELDYMDLKKAITELQNQISACEYIVMPSSEALNRFFLKYRELFYSINCSIPLVKKELYEIISNKKSFSDLCFRNGILTPKDSSNYKKMTLPFVAKPLQYFSKDGSIYSPIIINTKNDLNIFLTKYKCEDFYFQEFIQGDSYYLLYYFCKNGNIKKFSQKNLIQQENGKSILLAESAKIHLHDISNLYESLFLKIKFFGLVMIEIKFFQNNYYMIEANPRFWGPSQLFVDANVNLFEYMLQDYNILKQKINQNLVYKKSVTYFWDDGLSKNYETRKNLAYYNYTINDFLKNIKKFKDSEIFARNDILLEGIE